MCCFQYSHLSQKRRLLFRVIFDIISIVLGIFAVKYGMEPYHRGFFCDDESIQHPVLSDTVPYPLVACIGTILPFVVIVVLEFSLQNNSKTSVISVKKSARNRTWFGAIYNTIAVFVFGIAVTQFLTEVGKHSIGRLRPNFLALCNPDMKKVNCSVGYITADVCTSTDLSRLKDARLSFPSGHSSFSMYCTMYLILYLQARISCDAVILVKPVIQLVLFAMGFYTCLSRISDYRHHWSDVLSGAILGMVVCVCVIVALADFGQGLCSRGTVCGVENEALVLSGEQSVEEGSVTTYYERKNLVDQERQRLLQTEQE